MIRVAVIGAGPWGMNHVRAVTSEPSTELASVADCDPVARERVRSHVERVRSHVANCAVHDDADRVLADPSIDAVIIATPAPSHAALACAALAAGKHVLVEKPLALSLADARRVAETAARSRRVAMVGHLMVFHPALARMRDLVRGETLGPLRYLHSTRANLGRIRREESVLWSFGPHELSMFDYLLGRQPTSVTATGRCIAHPDVEDVVFLTLHYATGELAHVHLSRVHPHKERVLNLVCANKLVQFDDVAQDKLRIFERGYEQPPEFAHFDEFLTLRDGAVHVPALAMQEPLRLQLRHFSRCITERVTPITDVASGVRTVEILDAAQRSLEQGGAPVGVARATP
jgi:predicted dehydrogenase